MSIQSETLVTALLSSVVAAVVGLLGGVVLGGWYAFQSPNWRAFKAWIEGLPALSGPTLGLLVCVLAVGAGVGAAWLRAEVSERSASERRTAP